MCFIKIKMCDPVCKMRLLSLYALTGLLSLGPCMRVCRKNSGSLLFSCSIQNESRVLGVYWIVNATENSYVDLNDRSIETSESQRVTFTVEGDRSVHIQVVTAPLAARYECRFILERGTVDTSNTLNRSTLHTLAKCDTDSACLLYALPILGLFSILAIFSKAVAYTQEDADRHCINNHRPHCECRMC